MTVTAPEGSTVMRRRLGAELERLRNAAGVTMERAAQALDCARSKISHIENGRYGVKLPDLEALLRLYGAYDRLEELDAMRRAGVQPGWWSRYDLPSWLGDLIGLEQSAMRVRVVELELMPALLQTEAYARRIHQLGTVALTPAELDRRVAVRLERAKRLTAPNPLELSAVISESALRRVAADPSVGPGQLQKLVDDIAMPNVSLRVLPLAAGLHASAGSFIVLDFDPNVPLKAAYEESAIGGRLIEDGNVVRALSDLHDQLRSRALDDEASLTLITQLLAQPN